MRPPRCCVIFTALTSTTCAALRTSLHGPNKAIGVFSETNIHHTFVHEYSDLDRLFPAYNLSVPIDHFLNESRYEPHTNDKFALRYWFDATYYKHGGPVFVVQGGETSGKDRLPFLQKGLVHQMAKEFNGIGVILEHRYYGKSFPTPDLSTENLRFLTTEQALADEAYFAKHVQFPGLSHHGDLTSDSVPYIGYGGSYAGAFNAFLRIEYPDVFWGTISSSGVTFVIHDYWQYYQPIADFANQSCVETLQSFTDIVDNIIFRKNDTNMNTEVKSFFGLPNITHLADFAAVLTDTLGYWQAQNWDPSVSTSIFDQFCRNITSTDLIFPATHSLRHKAKSLIQAGGYRPHKDFVNQFLNYIGYINATRVAPCTATGRSQDRCFGSYNMTDYQSHKLSDEWRAWPYQYCTEWGFLQTGSGVPKDQLPLISRTIDIEHESQICKHAFNITTPPDLQRVNKYGGYDISYPRLAIIDGDRDPWRPATPHAFEFGAKNRSSTTSEPFLLIENAIHHYDQNGLFPNETTPDLPPAPIKEVQAMEMEFVRKWLEEWKTEKLKIKTDL